MVQKLVGERSLVKVKTFDAVVAEQEESNETRIKSCELNRSQYCNYYFIEPYNYL